MATDDGPDPRVRYELEMIARERDEIRRERYESERRAEHQLDRILAANRPMRLEQRIVSALVAIVLGVGAVGYRETDRRIDANTERIDRVQLEEEHDEQRIDQKLAELGSKSDHRPHHDEHPQETHEDEACICRENKGTQVRSCWMGAPCDPTGAAMCQRALPDWTCRAH